MNDEQALRRALETIRDAWTSGRTERLVPLFHPDMLIVGPGYRQLAVGRDACVESYRAFSASAEVVAYRAVDAQVDVWGDTAVCTYARMRG